MKSIIYQGRVLAVPQANGEFIFSHLPDPDPDPDPGSPHKCVLLQEARWENHCWIPHSCCGS